MPQRLPPPHRYVYVIGPNTGLQKIGIATDPRGRLAALQTASPSKLILHASIAVPFGAAHDVERRAHHRLRAARASGERFDVTAEEAIEAVEIAASTLPSMHDEAAALPLFAFSREVQARPLHSCTQPPGVRSGLSRRWKAARRSLAAE
jgi:hypothetical protein